ncbi:response regulator transcription factor [Desertifilum sp. FACHB-1129]|uniref:response regulator transcription factor n=1 Tax=unclassified Desertifilum TaxID=2621682 RepID=UPI0016898CEF|nr:MULTISPECIES: response regulator transcription factor [unclassified Desertifilum]MBD2310101.1 response regulator transcription factor [Desertifilum sp. FACHB-1129]MBD2322095.1 response regulator transcription factor [Desertifilum sp. FACHB-866]MBD2333826.1 response regulator transcription factor [Desertifilum sp. FACHB-868]MDA0211577.1 response regulator transcription factor [Cyanobacteria bacterium FC1]
MILFIDDEYRRVKPYIQELESSNHKVEFKDNIDDALESCKKKQKEIKLIVLDIMMPIGDDFNESAKQEAEFGLNTGVYFYKKYLKDKNIPVILFTHLSDLKLPEKSDNQVYLLKKLDYLPHEFVQKVEDILRINYCSK